MPRILRTTFNILGLAFMLALLVYSVTLPWHRDAPPITLEKVRGLYGDGVKYVNVSGVEVAYKDEGEGDTIVLLHGSFGNLHMFDGLTESLSKQYRVIRYDQPPSGLSGPVAKSFNLNPEQFFDAFLNALNVNSATLIGTSSGGIIAYRFAATYPQKTDALILSNVPPSAPVDNDAARARLPFYLRHSLSACIKYSRPFSSTCWRDFLVSNYWETDRVNDDLVARYFDLNRRPGSFVYTSMTPIMRVDQEVIQYLSKISSPTLLLWGDKDPVLPPATATTFQTRLSSTEADIVWLTDVSHYPPLEAPKPFAEQSLAFLASINQQQETEQALSAMIDGE